MTTVLAPIIPTRAWTSLRPVRGRCDSGRRARHLAVDDRTPIRSKLVPPRLRGPTVRRPRVDALLDDAGGVRGDARLRPAGLREVGRRRVVAARPEQARGLGHGRPDTTTTRCACGATSSRRSSRRCPGVGAAARQRLGAGDATADPAIEVLAGELEADGRALIIVVDDLDRVTSARRLATITHAIRALPAGVRLVLIARSDPELPLPRLRANGQLAELRAPELAFTRDEAAQLLAATEGLELAGARARRAGRADRGLARRAAPRRAAAEDHRRGAGGLHRPPSQRRALPRDRGRGRARRRAARVPERTSVLPRLCAGLCDHVLEHVRLRRSCSSASRRRTCSSSRSTRRASGSATRRCSPSTASAAGLRRPGRRPRACTGAPRTGSARAG